MNSTLLSIKTDPQTKQDLQAFAKELGISSTAFVNMVIKQALRDRRITLSTSLEPTPYLQKLMKEADEDYKNGDFTATHSPEEALAHLDKLMKK